MESGEAPKPHLKGVHEYPPKGGRKRYTRRLSDPDGRLLPTSALPPQGRRTPNNHVWGHNLDELFWISRGSEKNCWSRSMVKDSGENCLPFVWQEPEELSVPHLRKPWPLLALNVPDGEALPASAAKLNLGIPFKGCLLDDVKQTPSGNRASADAECIPKDVPSGATNSSASTSALIDDRHEDNGSDAVAAYGSTAMKTSPDPPQNGSSSEDLNSKIASEHADECPEAREDETKRNKHDPEPENGPKDCLNADETDSKPAIDDSATVPSDAPKPDPECVGIVDAQPTDGADKPTKNGNNCRGKYDFEAYSQHSYCSTPPLDSPFSVESIPPLQEFIPKAFFPDFLMVHDPYYVAFPIGLIQRPYGSVMAPIKYRRKYPKLNSKYRGGADVDGSENVAHLYLHPENRLGVGSHSTVYHAALQLPAPLTARTPNGRVRVAAKVSPHLGHVDEEMLCNEAEMYNAFPKHLAEDWCGYNLVPPDPHPVPVGAVVPKFYGFYEPYNIHGRSQRPGPILLLEECGEQICADSLTQDQKTECMSLIHRLHLERIVQGSCHARNILRQPGPLYLPPEQRSSETPSFRIIDFGRGRRFASAGLKLQDAVRSEQREARKTLWLDN